MLRCFWKQKELNLSCLILNAPLKRINIAGYLRKKKVLNFVTSYGKERRTVQEFQDAVIITTGVNSLKNGKNDNVTLNINKSK